MQVINPMLKPAYQNTVSWKIYEVFKSPVTQQIIGMLLMAIIINAVAAQMGIAGTSNTKKTDWGASATKSGQFGPTDWTEGSVTGFMQNLGLTFTAARIIGSVIVACGLVMTAIRYRAEDQAQRAQELLVRGGAALLIINILPTVLRFVSGGFVK